MVCIYCKKEGQGKICTDCLPTCIICNSKDIVGEIKSISHEKYNEKIVWCNNCHQILPVSYTTQDYPAEDMSESQRKKYKGKRIDELKS